MPRLLRTSHLLLVAIAIQVATLALLICNALRLQDVHYTDLMRISAQEQSAALARALAPDMLTNQPAALLHTLEISRQNPSLDYVGLFNYRGERMASLGDPPPPRQNLFGDLQHRELLADGVITIEHPVNQSGKTLGLLQIGYRMEQLQRLTAQSAIQHLIIALVGILLSGAAIALAHANVKQGLDDLNSGLVALHEDKLSHRAPVRSSGTLGETAGHFNALADHLQTAQLELRNKYEQTRQESRRLTALLQGIQAVVWEFDPDRGRFQYVSSKAQSLLGYSPEEWLRPDFCQLHVHPDDRDWLQGFLKHPGMTTDSFTLDFRIYNNANDCLWLRLISTIEIREQGPVLAGLLLDVTEEKQILQRITYLANHDSLTGLINRRRFQERLDEQIAYNRRYGTIGALLFIDLDQFKYINDSFGHHIGDEYLRQVSTHLRNLLGSYGIIGRLGGDEFGIILPTTTREKVKVIAENLLKRLNQEEFIHECRRIYFNASIGIVLFPDHGGHSGDLLAKADSTLNKAKDWGRNTYFMFEDSVDMARMQEKIHWEDRIRHALMRNRFQLYFQPIVDIHTGAIRHYETLLRMLGDNDEVITPGVFTQVAERFGLIREIDRWVIDNAIRAQARSRRIGKPVSLTINLSGRHFGDLETLHAIQEATQRHGADPNNIVFEVTETAAVENYTAAAEFIRALRAKGYRFAVDDFGAGFTSFDYLKRIPVDYIKIDGGFVRNLHQDRIDQIFTKAVTDMAQHLKVVPIAESVENDLVLTELRKIGVPLGQGYFFAKPAPRFHEHARIIIATGAEA